MPESTRIFSLIAPIRVEFMGEKYKSANDSQRDTINKINEMLDSRIIQVGVYENIAAHADEYVFFRTDHHWTALGAYYAYLAFAEAAAFEPITLHNYTEHALQPFIGSLAVGTQNKDVLNHPDTLYYYELNNHIAFSRKLFFLPSDMSKLSYRVFIGGDAAKIDFTSSNKNGKTVVIIKDSYANALVPWLAPHYESIVVIDPRQYTGRLKKLLNEVDQADLLFVNYSEAVNMGDFIKKINDIR